MDCKDVRSPNKIKREVFHPSSWWTNSPSSDFLLIDLPGFRLNDIKIELLSTAKLSVKGRRQLASNMDLDLDETFDVPKETITEQISKKFENGVLTFTMPKRVVEVIQPTVEWNLVIQLPGFKDNEIDIKVSVEGDAERVLVKGRSHVSQNKYLDLNQSFEIPRGTITNKMKRVFINGSLTIIMPKRAVEEHKSAQYAVSKDEEAIQNKPKGGEDEEDEPVKERTKVEEDERNESVHRERQPSNEEQQLQKEKPKASEDFKDELIEKENQSIERENVESSEEKKVDSSMQKKEVESNMKGSALSDEVEEKKDEAIKMEISKERGVSLAKTKERRKIMDGLLGTGSIACLRDKLNTNIKLIVVALVAFFVGYISCTLRACRK